jgi:hypothetical protein
MNRDRIEKWILLDQSGELDPLRRWILRRALRADAGGRGFESDLHRIIRAARAGDERLSDLPPRTIEAIFEAARQSTFEGRSSQTTVPAPVPGWRPAMAFAALILLLGAVWLTVRRPEVIPGVAQAPTPADPALASQDMPWVDGLEQPLNELSSVLELAYENGDVFASSSANGGDLDDLARQLLEWEGSEI